MLESYQTTNDERDDCSCSPAWSHRATKELLITCHKSFPAGQAIQMNPRICKNEWGSTEHNLRSVLTLQNLLFATRVSRACQTLLSACQGRESVPVLANLSHQVLVQILLTQLSGLATTMTIVNTKKCLVVQDFRGGFIFHSAATPLSQPQWHRECHAR